MADKIQNSTIKSWIIAGFFIFLTLFFLMWAYIYGQNFNGLPAS